MFYCECFYRGFHKVAKPCGSLFFYEKCHILILSEFMSYLVYHPSFEALNVKLMGYVKEYLPESIVLDLNNKATECMEQLLTRNPFQCKKMTVIVRIS